MTQTHTPLQETSRTKRLEARMTPQQQELLQQGARLRGLSVTEFVLSSAERAARRAIREQRIITLTTRDSAAFAETLLNPSKPNAALRAAFARHDQEVASDV